MTRRVFSLVALLATFGIFVALAPASNQPYVGSWKAHLTSAQLLRLGDPDVRLAGTFTLVIAADGTYQTFNTGAGSGSGTFTVSGHRIVFWHDQSCINGYFQGDYKGVYRWSVRHGKLRLTGTNDHCGSRWEVLTYPIWTRG